MCGGGLGVGGGVRWGGGACCISKERTMSPFQIQENVISFCQRNFRSLSVMIPCLI